MHTTLSAKLLRQCKFLLVLLLYILIVLCKFLLVLLLYILIVLDSFWIAIDFNYSIVRSLNVNPLSFTSGSKDDVSFEWICTIILMQGMAILTLAVSLPSLRPPACTSNEGCENASILQTSIFYSGLYLLAVGAGGTKSNISTFGADQFDDFNHKEKNQKNSFFNWWMFTIFLGTLVGKTFLIYIEDQISWGVSYGTITAALVISFILFLFGTPFYRHKVLSGSPLKRMGKVIARVVQNWKVQAPLDPSQLFEVDSKEYFTKGRYPIAHTHTRILRSVHFPDS